MKRFLTILTAFIFLLPAVGAARAAGQSPFCDALTEAVSSFSFEGQGCRMDLSVPGQEFYGTLQAGDGIWEIDLGPWGKAQLLNDQLVYLYGDVPFVLDLSPLSKIIRDLSEPEALRECRDRIGGIVKQYLIDPFAAYAVSDGRVNVHVDIESGALKEQLKAFIGALLQEAGIDQYYAAAFYALRAAGLYIPERIEDLPDYIVDQIPFEYTTYDYDYEYDKYIRKTVPWRIEGDLFVSGRNRRIPDIVFSGCFRMSDRLYPLYFETCFSDGRTIFRVDADTTFGGISCSFDGCNFMAQVRDSYSGRISNAIEGTYDRTTGAVDAEILDYEMKSIGRISGCLLRDSADLTIRNYEDTIQIYLKNDKSCIYGKVRNGGRGSFSYDLLLSMTPEEGFQARVTGKTGYTTGDLYCSVTLNDGSLSTEFSYPYGDWRINGQGKMISSPNGVTQSIDFEAVTTNIYYRNGYQDIKRIQYVPGRMSALIDDNEYLLEKTADSAEKMAYQLSVNGEMLYALEMELARTAFGKGFSALLSRGGEPIVRLTLTPVEKQIVEPVDLSNAVYLTSDTINAFVGILQYAR